MALGVDHLHQERSGADRPRVRVGLTLTDDFPSRVDIDHHEGEWIVGRVHSATTPSRRRPYPRSPTRSDAEPARLLPAGSEEVTLAKSKLDAVIASVPLFESLSKRHVKKLAGLTSTVEYDAGDTVIQEGEPGDSFFVTVSGQAKVLSGGKTLHKLIPGDHFGEISLLDGRPRSASVVAETPLSLLRLPRGSFLRLIKEDADLARALLASLARMVRRVDRSLAR
jgi:CRP/FNR family transcriptional regulator, cyclic AMP receptor protein